MQPDDAHAYINGAWIPTKTLPQELIMLIEDSLAYAMYLLKCMAEDNTPRSMPEVFTWMRQFDMWDSFQPVEEYQTDKTHWSAAAMYCGISLWLSLSL